MKAMTRLASLMALALLLLPFSTRGQDAGFITLYGHISDNATSESLYYSSVNLSGTSVKIVSNSDGYFSLKIPETTPEETDVLISHLGYQTGSMKVSAFKGSTPTNPLEIHLISTSILLDAATIHSLDPEILVRSAYYKVKDNYPAARVGMTAFYREMICKGARYLSINEAVIDIDKASYSGYASDKVGIYKGRGSTDYDISDTLFVKFQGGIFTALELDQVKNPLAGVTLVEAMKSYDFFMEGMDTYDGYSFYKIGFRTKPTVEEIMFKGSIYIETESLAIGRVEMEMDLAGREEEAANIFVVKKPLNVRMTTNQAKYLVSYKCFDGKWYYDYCRADLIFTSRKQNSLFKKTFSLTEEMAVTNHNEGEIAIEPTDRVRFKDILSDKVADFADENFWEDYNIIEPDQSIDAIIKKIVRKLDRRKTN